MHVFMDCLKVQTWCLCQYLSVFFLAHKCSIKYQNREININTVPLLLLLLSRLSRVRLCATPYTAAHQAPLSLGFSRQEHWSGLPFPSSMHESEKWKWSRSVLLRCPTPSDPMDCSLPGSFVHGICQARVLEWVAIAFSNTVLLTAKELMLLNCGVGEDSWEFLGLQGDQTSQP